MNKWQSNLTILLLFLIKMDVMKTDSWASKVAFACFLIASFYFLCKAIDEFLGVSKHL